MPRYLTTHQMAGLLGVSERTVANWIDRGHLDAFRTPGGHRRVAPSSLRDFLEAQGIPIPPEITAGTQVLVVEDDPLVAAALVSHLEEGDGELEVSSIGDGISALIQIGNRKPRLILLDIIMPGMDGLEVCRRIRQNEDLKDVQVVFVTGYADLDRKEICRETGAVDVIFKPVSGENLRRVVDRVLGRKPQSIHPA